MANSNKIKLQLCEKQKKRETFCGLYNSLPSNVFVDVQELLMLQETTKKRGTHKNNKFTVRIECVWISQVVEICHCRSPLSNSRRWIPTNDFTVLWTHVNNAREIFPLWNWNDFIWIFILSKRREEKNTSNVDVCIICFWICVTLSTSFNLMGVIKTGKTCDRRWLLK